MLRRLSIALLALGLTTLAAQSACAQTGISQKVATCDPAYPTRCIKPNASGAVPITGSISATTSATATAAAPTYIEGTDNPLSVDLSGNLRTTGSGGGGASVTATAVAPDLVEGSTNNNISATLKGETRSIISNGGVTATVTAGNALKVDGSAVTQPVSAASLPLPTGAATAAKQPAIGTAGTASTDVITVQGIASGVAQPVSGTVAATQSGTWNVSNVSGTVSLPTGASTAALQGVQGTGLNPPTGGSGEIGFLSGIYNQVISTSAQAVAPQAQTTGGCTAYGFTSAATTNSTLISTGAHTLCSLNVINTTATVYYLRMYNTAAAPTCSSATGFVFSLPIPASATGAGAALPLGPFGLDFGTGLSFCLTGGGSSTDNTSAATGVYVIAGYK